MTEENKTETTENLVTMENGKVINFGQRARVISTVEITDTSFSAVFNVVSGRVFTYTHKVPAGVGKFTLELAAFGAAAKVKNVLNGVKDVTAIEKLIQLKLDELNNGIINSRGNGQQNLVLTQVQEAYAIKNNLDKNNVEHIKHIKETFEKMSKEEKSSLMKDKEIRVAIAKIKLDQAMAELENLK